MFALTSLPARPAGLQGGPPRALEGYRGRQRPGGPDRGRDAERRGRPAFQDSSAAPKPHTECARSQVKPPLLLRWTRTWRAQQSHQPNGGRAPSGPLLPLHSIVPTALWPGLSQLVLLGSKYAVAATEPTLLKLCPQYFWEVGGVRVGGLSPRWGWDGPRSLRVSGVTSHPSTQPGLRPATCTCRPRFSRCRCPRCRNARRHEMTGFSVQKEPSWSLTPSS